MGQNAQDLMAEYIYILIYEILMIQTYESVQREIGLYMDIPSHIPKEYQMYQYLKSITYYIKLNWYSKYIP